MKKLHKLRNWSAVAVLLFAVTIISCKSSSTESTNPFPADTIYSISSTHYGHTFDEWAAKWWQWAYQQPVHNAAMTAIIHPLLDSTGQFAANGQDASSPVFFLGGWLISSKSITRNVTISSSKSVFFPLLNVEADTTGSPTWNRDSIISALNSYALYPDTMTLTIDGNSVPNLKSYKVRSADFSLTLPADNVYQFQQLIYKAGTIINPVISDGYWIMLAPLSKGQHVIHFTGAIPSKSFSLDVTYYITSN